MNNGMQERIDELVLKHGTLRAVGRVLKVDPGYLSRLRRGIVTMPSNGLLRRMRLRRVIYYVRAQPNQKISLAALHRVTSGGSDAY